jgi:hypothetical protein
MARHLAGMGRSAVAIFRSPLEWRLLRVAVWTLMV